MSALKESLKVPDRMGWNGNPCAPTSWNACEGVTCHPSKEDSALVGPQIDLGSQGLKGYISEEISLLSNLVSLRKRKHKTSQVMTANLVIVNLVIVNLSKG